VEELAEANEETLSAYGMGSRDMKARAGLFLANGASDSGPLVAKLRAAEELISSMQVRMDSMEAQLKATASDSPVAPALKKL